MDDWRNEYENETQLDDFLFSQKYAGLSFATPAWYGLSPDFVGL